MPLPTSISDLSQTPASNSPSGSETPNLIDEYFQVYAAYIAQLRDGPGFVSGVKSNVLGTVSLPSYSFVGDADTGMFSPAANTLAWSLGGAERMRIESSGNTRITAATILEPTLSLRRTSDTGQYTWMEFERADGTRALEFISNGSVASYGIPANAVGINAQGSNGLHFSTADTLRMTIDGSGNLIQLPPTTPPTLTTNGELVITPTSNTNVRISYRGSDGVTRVGNITLA